MRTFMHRSFAQSLVVALAFILGLAPTKHYAVAQPGPQDSPPQKTEAKNLMAKEASPYLRQHAGDPVHWQPWGDEAFKRAKAEGKPVFLSIGYAACHWCHVMQRESFQDVEVAKVLNEKFISIKLDREERPDVDRIYMQAAHSLGKRGGWPLTVFLTADRKPFVVETYIPRDPFLDFIKRLSQGFETAEGRKKIQEYSKSLTDAMRSRMKRPPAIGIIQQKQISAAAEALRATEDKERGGFGSAPKFPSPSQPLWLLRQAARAGDATTALEVKRLLDALIKGGIRDHLAGGFHRYSTDANWVVPHFEKMLYDQAMLTMLFVEGWKVWGDARYEAIARETIDWVLKDMVTQEGAFISAYDADADHIEGLTYVWSLKELNELLTKQEAAVIIAWSGASAKGNWEHGRNILYEANSVRDVSTKLNVPAFDVQNLLDSARPKLLKARVTHPQPAKDTKVLLGWNALMVSALAQASFAFGEPRYLEAATRAVGVFETHMKQKSGRYHRSFTAGRAQHAAELADHAAYANACLDILAATLDREWLDRASVLQRTIDGHFLEEDGGYADSLESDLLFRTRDVHDGVRPSGSSLMLLCLARLAVITADPKVQERAEETAKSVSALVSGGPQWSPHALIAIDLLINPSPKVEAFGPNAETLLIPLRSSYSPFAHITRGKPVETAEPAREPSILVCVGQICLEPVEKASELLARIASALKP